MFIEPKLYPVVATADYQAVISKCEEVQSTWEGETRQRLQWTFELGRVLDQDGEMTDESAHVMGWTSLALSPKSNLWKLAVAAGLDPSAGVSTDDLIGRKVTLAVTVAPRDGGGEKNVVDMQNPRPARVSKGKPAGGAAQAPAAQAMPAYVSEDLDTIPF